MLELGIANRITVTSHSVIGKGLSLPGLDIGAAGENGGGGEEGKELGASGQRCPRGKNPPPYVGGYIVC
jgi:hypothetical protein